MVIVEPGFALAFSFFFSPIVEVVGFGISDQGVVPGIGGVAVMMFPNPVFKNCCSISRQLR